MISRLLFQVSALSLSSLLAAPVARAQPTIPADVSPTDSTLTEGSPTDAAVSESAESEATAVDPAIVEPSPPQATRAKKTRAPKVRRARRHIPFRAGTGLFVGGTMPDAAPALGFAFRGGLQRNRWGFMLEAGLSGAVGGALSSGDVHSSRTTFFYHGYIAPMAELNLEPLFVSLGVPLGVGMWSATRNTVDAVGTVQSEARSTTGLVAFIAGLDARFGRRFGFRHHHLTVALGTKVLFAKEDEATSTVQPDAISGSRDTGLGVQFVPTLTVGYDYF